MEKLFKLKDIRRFFNLLEAKERSQVDYYLGFDGINHDHKLCGQDVFVRRTIAKWFKGKVYKVISEFSSGFWVNKSSEGFGQSEEIMVETVQYMYITRVSFYYGYQTKIEVSYIDAINSGKMSSLTLDFNDILSLTGEEIKEDEWAEICDLFKVEEVKCEGCDTSILHSDIPREGKRHCSDCYQKEYTAIIEAKVEARMKELEKKKQLKTIRYYGNFYAISSVYNDLRSM